MRLDVLVATCERPVLLSRTVESLLTAPVPAGTDVHVTVIQSDAFDTTRDVIQGFDAAFTGVEAQ